jgi:Family of unknown function (DUF5309)
MPANAFLTTVAIGNREDLVDVIYNTAPTDTPLISAIEKVKATAVTHEWQRDVLATPASNAVAEGADATYTAITPTARLNNQTQISRKSFSISDTQERVNKAGRKSDIRYQTVKQGKELRKDMELACIENPTYTTGATRVTKGLRGFCVTNNSLGATGVAPAFPNTAPTDGTLRNITEAFARAVVLGCYQNGGNISMLMCAPASKQTISNTFTGNGTKFIKGEMNKVEGAWDVWGTDFGDLKIVPNRVMQRTREIYFIDTDMCALAVLRDMEDQELARVGSARNFMIESEYALEVREERALGAGRDFN